MQDNWYEASVSASAPYNIISVVDWASDAPLPKPPKVQPATYNVFQWGINDPSVGNRSIEKENFDPLASPVGWHSLPYANDPSYKGTLPAKEFYRNTTTTWGNNVSFSLASFSPHRLTVCLQVFAQESRNDELIGEGEVDISQTISETGEFDGEQDCLYVPSAQL